MLAFGIVFVVASRRVHDRDRELLRAQPDPAAIPWLTPSWAASSGVFQAALIIGILILILDSYFRGVGVVAKPSEFLLLRDLDHAIDVSQTAKIFRHDLIPAFFVLLGGLIPEDVRALYRG